MSDSIYLWDRFSFGSGLSSVPMLRSSGAVTTVSYAANGFSPQFVADFNSGTYLVGGEASTFVGAFSHSRASIATFIDADGILQTVTNTPRTDHHIWNGSQWVGPSLLIESFQRTNSFERSNDFTNPVWVKRNGSITNSSVAGPLGQTAQEFTASGSDAAIIQAVESGFSAGVPYTLSAWIRCQSGTQTATIAFNSNSFPDGDGDGGKFKTITLTTEWQRFSLTSTATTSNTGATAIASIGGFGGVTTGDVIEVFGAQAEAGSSVSSYIPRVSAVVTRVAEALDIVAADAPYSATAMSGAVSAKLTYGDSNNTTTAVLYDRRVDVNNRITVALDTAGTNTGRMVLTVVNGGTTTTVQSTSQLTPGIDVAANVAWRVTTGQINIALNGTAETAVTNAAGVPDVSSADATIAVFASLEIERHWPEDIGDAGIVEATVGLGTAPAIADGQEWFANSTDTTIDGSASGTGLTFSYVLTGAPAGVTINASTGLITVAPTAIASGTITITATDQYGRVLTDTFTFTSVEVSIALSAFSVVQNGTDFDVAVTVTDDPDIPLDFYLVGIANGATAPSAAQIIAGTDSTDTAATIVLTFSTSVTGAQNETITTPADGTYDFYMVARDTNLDVSNTVTDTGVVYTGFSIPLGLSPSLWLDADDATTITDTSGEVTEWADKSGNSRHATGTATRYPITGTRTIGGLNALDFDGSNDRLFTSAAVVVNGTTGSVTAFVVMNGDNVGGIRMYLSQDASSGTRMPQYLRLNSGAVEALRIANGTFTDAAGTAPVVSTTHILAMRLSAAELEAYIDGATNGATSITGSNPTESVEVSIGGSVGGGFPVDGLIGEVLMFPDTLTSAHMNDVGNYLATKWSGTWVDV